MSAAASSAKSTIDVAYNRCLMPASRGRIIAILTGAVAVFAVVSAVLVQILPKPLKPIDYMVVGSVATLISLVLVFFVLIAIWIRSPDVFFKRRKPAEPPNHETDRISTP